MECYQRKSNDCIGLYGFSNYHVFIDVKIRYFAVTAALNAWSDSVFIMESDRNTRARARAKQ